MSDSENNATSTGEEASGMPRLLTAEDRKRKTEKVQQQLKRHRDRIKTLTKS